MATDAYEGREPQYSEYELGHFAHRFRVSNDIDPERIRARMKHGVLELELPKFEHVRPRRIEISS